MTLTWYSVRCGLSAYAALAVLDACSRGAAQFSYLPPGPAQPAGVRHEGARPSSDRGYTYVANHTLQGSSELLVYREGTQNPRPEKAVTQGLVDVGGVAVDSSGDVYVANGRAGNVLEFSPGAAALVQVYALGLDHPTDVAVANGTLYVADRVGQIVEYAVGNGTPLIGIGGPGYSSQSNEGVAVDPFGAQGTFYASASSLSIPFGGGCPDSAYTVEENLLPTLWEVIPLSNNRQAWGLAFDANGNLYVSDPCANDVAIYSNVDYVWTYVDKVPGTFEVPLFLTIDNQFLAIPSAASVRSRNLGRVTVIDLKQSVPTVTITNGLQHPVGAAAAPGY